MTDDGLYAEVTGPMATSARIAGQTAPAGGVFAAEVKPEGPCPLTSYRGGVPERGMVATFPDPLCRGLGEDRGRWMPAPGLPSWWPRGQDPPGRCKVASRWGLPNAEHIGVSADRRAHINRMEI